MKKLILAWVVVSAVIALNGPLFAVWILVTCPLLWCGVSREY